MKQSINIYDILPYQTIEQGVVVLRDGRVSIIFEVKGIELDLWNVMDFDRFNTNLQETINAMPDGLDITKLDAYYHEEQFSSNQVNEITKEHGFFNGKTAAMMRMQKGLAQRSYLILTLCNAKDTKTLAYNTHYAKICMKGAPKALSNFNKKVQTIKAIAEDFTRYFTTDIKLERLSSEHINTLIYNFLNLDFTGSCPDYFSQGFDYSDKRFLLLGQKKVNILTLKKTKEEFETFGAKDYGLKNVPQFATYPTAQFLNQPHITIQVIKKRRKIANRFTLEKTLTSMKVSSPLVDDYMRKAEVIGQELDQLVRENNDLSLYSHLVITWSLGDDDYYEKAKTALANLGQYAEETFDTANLFFSSLPCMAGDIYRENIMPISESSKLLSFTSNYQSDTEGDLYTDRLGNAVTVDFFHKAMHAKNAVVVGPTGSGKSFAIGYQILNAYGRGDILVLIDKGKTYHNLVSALGGKYFEYTEEEASSLSFNPFLLAKVIKQERNGKLIEVDANENDSQWYYKLTSDKVEFLSTLLEVLWKQTDKEQSLSKEEKALLQDKIKHFYKDCKNRDILPSLISFVDFVRENSDSAEDKKFFDVMSFCLCMKPYTEGLYKNLFASKDITRLDQRKLLCFEMEGIANNKSLFTILTLLIIELVMDFLRGQPQFRKHLIIDEAWALFGGEMGNFMEYTYRTIRKMNGRGVVITQSAADLEKSPIGDVLVGNSYLKMILNHSEQSTDALERVLNISPSEIGKIKSMRMESLQDNIGRELYIQRDGVGGKVYSLKVPKEVIPILTSKPSERDAFNKIVKTIENSRADEFKNATNLEIDELHRQCIYTAIEEWVKNN